jgi:hypothetical protein
MVRSDIRQAVFVALLGVSSVDPDHNGSPRLDAEAKYSRQPPRLRSTKKTPRVQTVRSCSIDAKLGGTGGKPHPRTVRVSFCRHGMPTFTVRNQAETARSRPRSAGSHRQSTHVFCRNTLCSFFTRGTRWKVPHRDG